MVDVIARSGIPTDVQEAIDQVFSGGGGRALIPSGDFPFNPPPVNYGNAVTIPPGVDLIGAGKGQTILRETVDVAAQNSVITRMLSLEYSGIKQPNRLAGFSLIGKVDGVNGGDDYSKIGIHANGRRDLRIDDLLLQDFVAQGAITWNCKGLIDHCTFAQMYKDRFPPKSNPSGQPWALWGYGVIVVGSGGPWESDITTLLGKYETVPENSSSQPMYIEDCDFTRCRHSIAANTNGFYVSRHNHFEKSSPYHHNDGHGGDPGTRLIECYDNVFDLTDESYSFGQDGAVLLRGGDALMFNNTVHINTGYSTTCLQLVAEATAPYLPHQTFAWNNTTLDVAGNPIPFRVRNNYPTIIRENIDYFLRAPTLAQDGFVYTPYTYPHPLTGLAGNPRLSVDSIPIKTNFSLNQL